MDPGSHRGAGPSRDARSPTISPAKPRLALGLLDSIRNLQLPDVAGDCRQFILDNCRLRRHVAEPPVMRAHAAPGGQRERNVGVVSRTVHGVNKRGTFCAAHRMWSVALGTVLVVGYLSLPPDGRELGNDDRPRCIAMLPGVPDEKTTRDGDRDHAERDRQ